MAITIDDIQLFKFLKKFTYQGDPNPGTKIPLPVTDFIHLAALLKLCHNVRRLKNKITLSK